MIKGLTKTVMIVNCEKDSAFEQALLVVRNNFDYSDEDIVEAANRLIQSAEKGRDKIKFWGKYQPLIYTFIIGTAAGFLLHMLFL